ncbi:MAG TPA: hypothetical protein VK899_03875 [Gemmatimonadales bacterium]|nr:hypothetical protein [Gemmatimonadales bacterium]
MAVAPQADPDPRKARADVADHPLHQGHDLAAARRGGLPQHGQDQPPAGVEDVDRQEAPVIIVGVELAQFLFAVDPIEALVEIQGEMMGHNRKAVAVELQHRLAHAIELRPPRQVLDARDGRLRAQRRTRNRRPVQRHLEGGIVPQHVAVIAIRVAGHDRQHAKPQDFIKGMRDLARLPRIMQASRQAVRQVQPPFDVLE